ncbi:hypothetical protein [Microvirga soli]|uniref:hypothetical protein n=1 Tax=Microvirga soli TaxID=1854496 RepID=UPI00191F8037|nr:hypothetical protein [Microvirga soli]
MKIGSETKGEVSNLLRRATALAAILIAPVALAQRGNTLVETAAVPLPPEKPVMVRQQAQRQKLPEVQTGDPIT